MTRFVRLSAALLFLGLGVLSLGARAGGGVPTLALDFHQTALVFDPDGPIVGATLTAMITNPGGSTFNAMFSSTDGFVVPGPIMNVMPTTCPLAMGAFTCTFSGLNFFGTPNNIGGTYTFTAVGALGTLPSESASFQATIPEPATLALLSTGLLGLGLARRKAVH